MDEQQIENLANLVGVAFNREGKVRQTLRRIMEMSTDPAVTHEVEMLDNFLRDNCPNEGMA